MDSRKLNVVNLGTVAYQKALDVQRALHERVMNNEAGDTLLLLTHPPVLTLGLQANRDNVYLSEEQLKRRGIDVFQIDRGGDVTYHGPGADRRLSDLQPDPARQGYP